ncbi:hypothetical protein LY90DRAFT_510143 [Neocallimastix californiae]|uniref:Uncharacterized protein n=1 Tax=Neocallimastix californiae TaxID=1754190 RepID=A0A1Y2C4I7_9FUNG|nr:hypothetical protein LY90DRAFT_510143 [Neocallimastix californiae]|eukprot:ORY41807.1 hypothetical protein LY90DRAFT_510143 [Neocallimastix californiae]
MRLNSMKMREKSINTRKGSFNLCKDLITSRFLMMCCTVYFMTISDKSSIFKVSYPDAQLIPKDLNSFSAELNCSREFYRMKILIYECFLKMRRPLPLDNPLK